MVWDKMSRMKCGIHSEQKVKHYLRRLRQGNNIKEVVRGGDLELQHGKLGRTGGGNALEER